MRHPVVSVIVAAAVIGVPLTALAQESSSGLMQKPIAAPQNALELKIGTGYTQGFGMLAPNRSLPSVAGGGLGAGLDVDYRLTPRWSFGVEGQYQELASEQNLSARGIASNIGATYHFAPAHLGDPWVRVGTGYRFVWENAPLGQPNTRVLRHGFDLAAVKVGYDVRLTEDVAIAPVIGGDVNMFLWETPSDGPGHALASPAVGAFIFAGLEGRFDLGGTRVGGARSSEDLTRTTSAEVVATPPAAPPVVVTTPVTTNISVSEDILRDCELRLGSTEDAPKFDFDKSVITAEDAYVLDQIAVCFATGPMKGMDVQLVGHTDPRGSEGYNLALGMRRANAVGSYLESAGVQTSQVRASSRGKLDATGHDPLSWANDRRVDITSHDADAANSKNDSVER